MQAPGAALDEQQVAVGDGNVVLRTYREAPGTRAEPQDAPDGDVVLVHGIGASQRYFGPLISELARSVTVHTLELPGFGTARRPRHPLQMEDFGDAAVQALKSAGINGAQWVGHSMGCQVVVEMALAAPDAASSLVLLGPTINDAERSIPRQALRLLQDCLVEPAAVNAIVFSDYLRAGPRWYLSTLPMMIRHRMEERLRDVQPPVLLVRGGRDPVVRADWVARLAAARPGTRVAEIEGQPHVMMYTRPAETAALIRSVVPAE